MMRCKAMTLMGAAASTLLGPATAIAHDPGLEAIPILTCRNEQRQIACKGHWPDGGKTPHARIEVVGYDRRIALSARLDDEGEIRFPRPAGPFVVVMEDRQGNGQRIEVDWRDIDATRAR